MEKTKHFERELNLIKDTNLRMMVESYMEKYVPQYFWECGASSSGKYHPKFSQGVGGLVRHTKAVIMFAEELLRMSSYAYMKEEYKDYVIVACLVHDTIKYGCGKEMNKDEYANHASASAVAFDTWCMSLGYNCSELLLNAIASHMGQWSTNKEDRPFTSIDRCVHMADYMASRAFIDIPQIVEEYNAVIDNDLPF